MERRSFLKGLLIGAPTATTALVQLASPAEAAFLIPHRDVTIGQPVIAPSLYSAQRAFLESPELYSKLDGEFILIGYMKELITYNSIVDATSWDSTFRVDVPGLRTMIGRMEG